MEVGMQVGSSRLPRQRPAQIIPGGGAGDLREKIRKYTHAG